MMVAAEWIQTETKLIGRSFNMHWTMIQHCQLNKGLHYELNVKAK